MHRAQKRAAVTEQKFWFRKQVYPSGDGLDHRHSTPTTQSPSGSPPSDGFHVPNGSGHAANGHGGSNGTGKPAFRHTPSESRCPSPHDSVSGDVDAEYEEMTINEVINGNVRVYSRYLLCPITLTALFIHQGGDFPGLLGLVNAYLNSLDVEFEQKRMMRQYLELVKRRADGELSCGIIGAPGVTGLNSLPS